ncbi:hypothetical protein [Filimonas effusa]|uniref:Uncharacterized protein n=1 Tax=Filimonas effusa TaxID=2508721 RepID=A0A4Q1DBT8_9BACT|nr:hypothetical protein [Filimonas effusa]RXK86255.1 hypothetical protein ESB13_05455 [Filimonas effusa]
MENGTILEENHIEEKINVRKRQKGMWASSEMDTLSDEWKGKRVEVLAIVNGMPLKEIKNLFSDVVKDIELFLPVSL